MVNTFYTTLRPQPYDAQIKWEETTTYNVGIDFGFANDLLTGSVEVFRKDTEDLLNFIGIPNGVNFSNFLNTNVGNMRNEGIEVSLSYNVLEEQDFRWNVGVNFTSINSEITKLLMLPEVKEQLLAQGAFSVTTTPEQAAARVHQEVTMWAKVIKEADVKPD